MAYVPVTPHEIAADDTLGDWRVLVRTLQAEFVASSFTAGGELAAAIAAAADAADHHPDLSLRYPGTVRVVLTTHAINGLSDADVALARTISGLAAEAGATAEPLAAERLEICIDTMDADRIRPFWAAVLAYKDHDGELLDPTGAGPALWFQQMDEPRTDRDRFHLDIAVAHDKAEGRVAAAIAAGGRLVSEEFVPSWWILADADGNEICVCTWEDREG
jgi:4a-hydroxytetrahydrobiopterin dehydratase